MTGGLQSPCANIRLGAVRPPLAVRIVNDVCHFLRSRAPVDSRRRVRLSGRLVSPVDLHPVVINWPRRCVIVVDRPCVCVAPTGQRGACVVLLALQRETAVVQFCVSCD